MALRFELFDGEPGARELAEELSRLCDGLALRVPQLADPQVLTEVRATIWPVMRPHAKLGACDSEPVAEVAWTLMQGRRTEAEREALYDLIRWDEERP